MNRILIPLCLLAACSCGRGPAAKGPDVIQQLVGDSRNRLSLLESEHVPEAPLAPDDVKAARAYVDSHLDHTSYHVLFALRRQAPEAYKEIPNGTKAAILTAALGQINYLNDWGYLLPPDGSHDDEAARALLETGKDAIEPLKKLLDDRKPAPLFGSQAATLGTSYNYRRCDFAYRYLSLLLGRDPVFRATPEERDKEVAQLKEDLAKRP